MSYCEFLEGCPFFNDRMKNMPALSEMYKKNYCKSDFKNCARYIVFKSLGKSFVPENLFPNEKDRAEEILKAYNK